MAFEQVFKNIDNALRTDEGCSSELDYVEQSSCRGLIDADDCDLLDVLEYIAYQKRPVNRTLRVQNANLYSDEQTPEQVAFIQYLVSVYVKVGIDELEADRLLKLMANKYGTIKKVQMHSVALNRQNGLSTLSKETFTDKPYSQ